MGCGYSRQFKDLLLKEKIEQSKSQFKDLRLKEKIEQSKSQFKDLRLEEKIEQSKSQFKDLRLKEKIEQSKSDWSILRNHLGYTDGEKQEFKVSNEEEFRALQKDPTRGSFFANFTGDGISTGDNHEDYGALVVGKKFAEGGQAELYEAQIKWFDPKMVERHQRLGVEYVVKVFKEGTLLRQVNPNLPQGLFLNHVKLLENGRSPIPKVLPLYTSQVYRGILLKDRRFAILMRKHHFDMHALIERNIKLRSGKDSRSFSKEEAESLMYQVALGVERLHNSDIVHRDLKASNVLVDEFKDSWPRWDCFVADYECSIGVLGTDFFRAPEILQACKDHKTKERPEVFSKAADVYSYGMVCYEILTGKLPFEGHPLMDRRSSLIDLVINKELRPEVPIHVEHWICELLRGCWRFDPTSRPTIGGILNILSSNSAEAKRFEDWLKEKVGKEYRW